jgi:hypothetical protein
MPRIATARFDLVSADRSRKRRYLAPLSQVVDIRQPAFASMKPRAGFTYDRDGSVRATDRQVGQVLATWA